MKKPKYSPQQKIDLAIQWKRSGISLGAWCVQNDVNESTMSGWLTKIRRLAPQVLEEGYQTDWVSVDGDKEGFVSFNKFLYGLAPHSLSSSGFPSATSINGSEPIEAIINDVLIKIPSGSSSSDIASVFRAARS